MDFCDIRSDLVNQMRDMDDRVRDIPEKMKETHKYLDKMKQEMNASFTQGTKNVMENFQRELQRLNEVEITLR